MSENNVSIEVLVFEGCPHVNEALELANAVADRLGPGISVTRVEVDTEEKAKVQKFLGSPTIRVNGRDVEGRTAEEGALCCRTYEEGAFVPPEWMVEAAVLRELKPKGLLFLCVANSARSQMGEGVARLLAPSDVLVQSAGSHPAGVRPEAAKVLAELGIDTSTHSSKNVSEIDPKTVDTVITLCGEEECPLFLGQAHRLHWGLPDPASVDGDDEARLDAFRQARDELRKRIGKIYPERNDRHFF
jgi:arsenate reductase (thioredoxin)